MITVENFVKEYNEINYDDKKEKFIKKHIVTDYLPFEFKKSICQSAVDACSHATIEYNGEEKKFYKIDGNMLQMMFSLQLIAQYTDIDIDFTKGDKICEWFNLLDKNDLIDEITKNISKKEMIKMHTMLGIAKEDAYTNECSNIAIFENIIQKINLLGIGLNSMVEELSKNPDIMKTIQSGLKNVGK